MTNAELTLAIQQFCESYETSFTANIPLFLRSAEERILNTVQLPALRITATKAVGTGLQYVGLPSDFLSAFSIATIAADGTYAFMLNKDANFIRAAYPKVSDSGQPLYYALFDDANLLIGPSTNANYTFEINYFAKPTSITTVAVDTETWLSKNFPNALLYGALIDANIYLKGEPDVQAMYTARFTEQMALLKQLGDGKDREDAYRSGQVRDTVQ